MSRTVLGSLAAACVLAAGAALWLWGGEEAPAPQAAAAAPPAGERAAPMPAAQAAPRSDGVPRDPLLVPDLLRVFEQMLGDTQTRDKAALMAEMRAKIDRYLPPDWRVRGLALLERYIDYLGALEALPAADIGDPAGLRRLMDARAALRARYFMPEEVDGLFGAGEKFDRFSIEKLEIERNKDLTPGQKREALARAEETWLTPEQRAGRKETTAQLDVAAQTAALDARSASPQERFAERSQQYGQEAAQRLATLDRQEQDWQARIARYASADEATRAQLQGQLFTPQEALRLEAALAMRAAEEKKKASAPP